jgi:hypothetical protein
MHHVALRGFNDVQRSGSDHCTAHIPAAAAVSLLRKIPYVAPQYLSRTEGQYNPTFAELTVKEGAIRRCFRRNSRPVEHEGDRFR